MIFGEDNFTFKPADFYPFKNLDEIARVRKITKEDILAMNGKHPTSPSMDITVARNEEAGMYMLTDIVTKILDSDRYDKKVVLIMPNPCPAYRQVAYMLRKMKVNCRNVKFYMMDEWADEDGNIAPLSYKSGFGNAFYRYMVSNILDLGFKEENFIYHSKKTTPTSPKCLKPTAKQTVFTAVPVGPVTWHLLTP